MMGHRSRRAASCRCLAFALILLGWTSPSGRAQSERARPGKPKRQRSFPERLPEESGSALRVEVPLEPDFDVRALVLNYGLLAGHDRPVTRDQKGQLRTRAQASWSVRRSRADKPGGRIG